MWTDVILVIAGPNIGSCQGERLCTATPPAYSHTQRLESEHRGQSDGDEGRDDTLTERGDTLFNEVRHKWLQVQLEMFRNCMRDVSVSAALLNSVAQIGTKNENDKIGGFSFSFRSTGNTLQAGQEGERSNLFCCAVIIHFYSCISGQESKNE